MLREQLHVSVCQIKTYLICPRKYELSYVRGIEPAFIPVPLVFGSAFHAALGHYYLKLQETRCGPPLEAVVQAFVDQWNVTTTGPVPLREEDGPADHLDRAAQMLAVFHAHAKASPPAKVDAVELPFSIELHDPDSGDPLEEKLVGAMDLVTVKGKKRTVVEFKTAAKRWSRDQVAFDLQLTAYRLAARQLDLGDVGLRLEVFTKTAKPAVQVEELRRGPADEEDLLRTVASVLRAVDVGAFHRVRGWACRGCVRMQLGWGSSAAASGKSRRCFF